MASLSDISSGVGAIDPSKGVGVPTSCCGLYNEVFLARGGEDAFAGLAFMGEDFLEMPVRRPRPLLDVFRSSSEAIQASRPPRIQASAGCSVSSASIYLM